MVYVIVSRLRKHKFTVKFGSSQLILYFCDTFVQESLDGAELHGQRAVIPGRSLLRVQTQISEQHTSSQPRTATFRTYNPLEPFSTEMNNLIAIAQKAFEQEKISMPSFKAGDTITVTIKIREGNKERLQNFRGVVLQRRGSGATETFTIRKISDGIGVERIFPVLSPTISNIELNKVGVVRRARIFYLRDLTGKKARIKEKKRIIVKK